MGRLEEARRDLDRAIELDPRHSNTRLHRAKLLGQLGDGDGALADLHEAELHAPAGSELLGEIAGVRAKILAGQERR